ncbi:DUF2256 domain-containing protein [Pusillimonas sp. NJUB218]|uniref:DUF2256 domain-containing protein n=1 Tax=Pusillimonas sp. NJUB218 TaxID=2023230 RepID=UPI000F4D1CB0|nr:hypothetical protein CHR62_09455 [Pusillimonas sp. NJUB218]
MRKKSDLPTKLCLCCGLPFTWRKKWERDWATVKYCSKRCQRTGKKHHVTLRETPPSAATNY